ncbi:MAG: hypothetical protein J6P72_07125 [Firmicutes bacterium]|nr:hypothetical protein [Bacillota bacterium]
MNQLDELKNAVPKTPESFHRMVEETVKEQTGSQARTILFPKQKKHSIGNMKRIAAIVIAAVLLIPTAVFAGIRFSQRPAAEPEGSYGTKVSFEVSGQNDTNESAANVYTMPDPFPAAEGFMDYIPEGMSLSTKDGYHLYDDADPEHRAFAFFSIAFDTGSVEDALLIRNVAESRIIQVGERQAVYLRLMDSLTGNPWNQRIYLLFPEEYRVLELIFTDGVSLEEAIQVAGGVRFELSSNEFIPREKLWTWSDMIEDNAGKIEVYTLQETSFPSNADIQVFQIGESYEANLMGYNQENGELEYENVSVRLDSIELFDDLSPLDPAYIPDDFDDAAGEDGKLSDAELSYVLMGDGVDTVDTVVATETKAQKLLYATVTFTNIGEDTLHQMGFFGSLPALKDKDGVYSTCVRTSPTSGPYSYILHSNIPDTYRNGYEEMRYCDVRSEFGDGGNNLTLAPGESKTVHLAWIVDEDLLPDLYLSLDPTGFLRQTSDHTAYLFDIQP